MAKKKSLNPVVAFLVFLVFLLIGGVGGIFAKIYVFAETYKIPETIEVTKEVTQGSLDVNVIKNEGYKQIKIISLDDKLPSDDILLQMLSDARTYFSQYPNHSWIEFNISTSTVRNAENLNGIPYDFGALRTIKDNDIPDIEQQTNKKGA